MSTTVVAFSCATQHAESLLRAWVAGDWGRLDEELDQVAELPGDASCGLEEERMDLLKALASQLKSTTPWHTGHNNDVRLTLCAKLLQNLIVQQPGPARLAAYR